MKPILLHMQYFGPFVDEKVDFTDFYTHPLFLISGKTGAGKTTIFDAMCFALFGETSGDFRSAKEMRSIFAPSQTETVVTFRFEVKQQIVEVIRKPEQILTKKKGEGLKKAAAKVSLTIFSEKGIEIAQYTKAREVEEQIQNLLHLDAKQFRQIVMLPQGDFRRFLNADSDAKEKLLRKLFHTEDYRMLGLILKQQKQALSKEVESTEMQTKILLQQADWLSDTDLEVEHLSITDTQQLLTKQQVEIKNKEQLVQQQILVMQQQKKELQSKYEIAQQRAHWQHERSNLLAEQQQLANQKEQMATLAEKIALLEKITLVKEPFLQQKYLQQDLLETQVSLKENAILKKQATKKIVDLEQQLVILQSQEATIVEKRQQKQKLLELQPVLEQFNLIEMTLKKQTQELNEQEAQLIQTSNELTNLQVQSVEIAEAEKSLQSTKEQLWKCSSEEIAKKQALIEQQALIKIYADHAQAEQQLLSLREKAVALEADIRMSETLYQEAKSHWASLQIVKLSLALLPGEPCPVCGATEHPFPYEQNHSFTEDEIQQSEQTLEQAELTLQDNKEQLATMKNNIKWQQAQTENFKLLLPQASLSVIQKGIEDLTETIQLNDQMTKKLQEKSALLEKKLRDKDKLTENISESTERKTIILENIQVTKEQVAIAKGQQQTLQKQLAKVNLSPTLFTEEINKLTKSIDAWDADFVEIQEKLQTAKQKSALLENNQVKWLAEQAELEKQIDEITIKIKSVLAEADVKLTMDELSDKMQATEQLPNFYQQRSEYQAAQKRVKDQLTQLADLLAKQDAVMDEDLKQKLADLEEQNIVLEKEHYSWQKMFAHNQQIIQQVTVKTAEQSDIWQRLTTLATLADVANGDSHFTHMSFERYVLTYFFQEVLKVANVRLQELTNHRYAFQLEAKDGVYKKNTGLEMNIYDDHAGGVRHVGTLSGGESFIAALALSLSLAEIVQQYAGGIQIETMFIDEGFGSLDEEALNQAMEALQQLEGQGRLIGIISHISSLKEQIADRILVEKEGSAQSKITIQHMNR